MEDVRTAAQLKADYLAVSFPKTSADMYMARQLLLAAGGHAMLIAKIERAEAVTEKALADIEQEAHRRWPLDATLIIHRFGRLEPGEDIVLVIAASAHREAAFEACHFLIDWLKTKAPFWKLEENDQGASWVAAKDSDDDAARRWSK